MNPPSLKNKEQLLKEFAELKALEANAGKYYLQIATNPEVTNQTVKNALSRISAEEEMHAQAMQEIIDIISTEL
ncbi:MAG: hypothetical protein WCT08_05230 [Patescibacteria group bacterium]|jgi:rubrerythrin